MKKKYLPILLLLISTECVIGGIAILKIYKERKLDKNVLSAVTVVPVKKNSISLSPTNQMKYYYEPIANTRQTDRADWMDYDIVYTINSDTLNDRYDYSISKPPGTFRIIALGDSFTFGVYVNTENAWPKVLEDLFQEHPICKAVKRVEVINLGVEGYDVQYIAHRFKTRGVKYNPDLIIWFESGSGFDRYNELLLQKVEEYKNSFSQEDILKYRKEGVYYPWYQKAYEEFHASYSQEKIDQLLRPFWDDFFVSRGNTPVVLATFSTISPENKVKLFALAAKQKNVFVMDAVPDINSLGGILFDTHPNERGHVLIAQALNDYFRQSPLNPCTKNN